MRGHSLRPASIVLGELRRPPAAERRRRASNRLGMSATRAGSTVYPIPRLLPRQLDLGSSATTRETLLQQCTDFVGHLRAAHGALRFDADMQAQGYVNGQALDALPGAWLRRAALDPLIRGHSRGRLGAKGDFLGHAANSRDGAARSSFTTASISPAACPSGLS